MEDDQKGRRQKWKTTKMEDDQNGRRPRWTMNKKSASWVSPKWVSIEEKERKKEKTGEEQKSVLTMVR